ncbi:hypothetical protein QE109_06300 [Fusibacter bizertensis]|uniref:Phosphatidate cytidylyltransferase n=1 Tax=Fusibacter bizertensis TaxID=1488331 RepID=A0ABT6NBF0_9FIRM|nr:hypothetical protein [Fusibacter bizertensis]MDH8677749.1 hypothetical protein [Fusibacter bizertensis]
MGDYKLTRRGLLSVLLLLVLAVFSLVKGSIYLAVFTFVFCCIILAITLYEVLINR